MDVLYSFVIAFSMYSRIPMPKTDWTERRMRYALCFFPAVGAAVGACVAGFVWLAARWGLGNVACACLGTALPLLITGGIHMDGFLDVSDARGSLGDRKKKLEIMKDPHLGAFAAIRGGVYLLLYLACFGELGKQAFPAAAGIYVLTRCASGWSVAAFPKAKKDGLAETFSSSARTGAVKAAMILWGLLAVLWMAAWQGAGFAAAELAVMLLVTVWYYRVSLREFGGITGDLAGYFLQICELCMIGAAAVWF